MCANAPENMPNSRGSFPCVSSFGICCTYLAVISSGELKNVDHIFIITYHWQRVEFRCCFVLNAFANHISWLTNPWGYQLMSEQTNNIYGKGCNDFARSYTGFSRGELKQSIMAQLFVSNQLFSSLSLSLRCDRLTFVRLLLFRPPFILYTRRRAFFSFVPLVFGCAEENFQNVNFMHNLYRFRDSNDYNSFASRKISQDSENGHLARTYFSHPRFNPSHHNLLTVQKQMQCVCAMCTKFSKM